MDTHKLLESLNPVIALFGDHPYLKAVVVLVLAIALANLLSFLISRVISRLVKRTGNSLDDAIARLLRAPLYWTVICIGVLAALTLLKLPDQMGHLLRGLVLSFLVVSWSVFAIQLTRTVLVTLARRRGERQVIRQQTLPLFNNIALVVVLAIAIYMMFQTWNIDMTAWLASAGIVGIAVGFAAKDTLANLFAGIFILADSPYKIDDYIVLDNGQRGKVTHIGLRSTRILTRDDVEVTVPNSIIGNSSVINESGGPHVKYRIRVPVGAAYGSDVDQVRAVLMGVAADDVQVCADPEPRVRFRRFGNSALEFELLCWVEEPELRGRAIDALNTNIYKQFLANGIEIPYSKHDVYIKGWPAGAADLPVASDRSRDDV